MKLQKVLASSLLCAVCCLSFKAQKTSANKETEKLEEDYQIQSTIIYG